MMNWQQRLSLAQQLQNVGQWLHRRPAATKTLVGSAVTLVIVVATVVGAYYTYRSYTLSHQQAQQTLQQASEQKKSERKSKKEVPSEPEGVLQRVTINNNINNYSIDGDSNQLVVGSENTLAAPSPSRETQLQQQSSPQQYQEEQQQKEQPKNTQSQKLPRHRDQRLDQRQQLKFGQAPADSASSKQVSVEQQKPSKQTPSRHIPSDKQVRTSSSSSKAYESALKPADTPRSIAKPPLDSKQSTSKPQSTVTQVAAVTVGWESARQIKKCGCQYRFHGELLTDSQIMVDTRCQSGRAEALHCIRGEKGYRHCQDEAGNPMGVALKVLCQ